MRTASRAEIEPLEPFRIEQAINRDDLATSNRERHHDDGPAVQEADNSCCTIDEHRTPNDVRLCGYKRSARHVGRPTYEQRLGRPLDQPTLAETMLQIASHSTYHRGQVNARLREAGGEPPLVDYIAWIWFGRPAPEWTAAAPASTSHSVNA